MWTGIRWPLSLMSFSTVFQTLAKVIGVLYLFDSIFIQNVALVTLVVLRTGSFSGVAFKSVCLFLVCEPHQNNETLKKKILDCSFLYRFATITVSNQSLQSFQHSGSTSVTLQKSPWKPEASKRGGIGGGVMCFYFLYFNPCLQIVFLFYPVKHFVLYFMLKNCINKVWYDLMRTFQSCERYIMLGEPWIYSLFIARPRGNTSTSLSWSLPVRFGKKVHCPVWRMDWWHISPLEGCVGAWGFRFVWVGAS